MASFDAKPMDTGANLPAIRFRSGKSKEELEEYRKSAKLTHQLNSEAKKAGSHRSFSYSLRDNGVIWKFVVNDNGAWKRVTDWLPAQQLPSSASTASVDTTAPVDVPATSRPVSGN